MIADLEIWLMGTNAQVDAAVTALAAAGRIAGISKPQTLFGADSGRVRRYLKVSLSADAHHATQRRGQGRAA